MQKLSKSDLTQILTLEFRAYCSVEVDATMVTSWWIHFNQCDRDTFFTAIHLAVANSTSGFPPVQGQVHAIIKMLNAKPEDLEGADQAWDAVWNNRHPSERAQAAAKLMPDWANRALWNTEYVPHRKREFERIYNTLKEQDEVMATQNMARAQLGYGRSALPEIAGALLKELGWK